MFNGGRAFDPTTGQLVVSHAVDARFNLSPQPSEASTGSALGLVRKASVINDAATIVSLGMMLKNPRLGAAGLAVTGIVGTGLGVTEGLMTGDSTKVVVSLGAAAMGWGTGRLATVMLGSRAATFNSAAQRYISSSTGRFVTTTSGATAVQIVNVADTVTGKTVEVIGDPND